MWILFWRFCSFVIAVVIIVFIFESFVIVEIFVCCVIFIYHTSFLSSFVIAYSHYYCHCLFSFSLLFIINHMSISQLKRSSWLTALFHRVARFMYSYKSEKAGKILSSLSVCLLCLLISHHYIFISQIVLSFDFTTISELNTWVLISQNSWIEALQHILSVIY